MSHVKNIALIVFGVILIISGFGLGTSGISLLESAADWEDSYEQPLLEAECSDTKTVEFEDGPMEMGVDCETESYTKPDNPYSGGGLYAMGGLLMLIVGGVMTYTGTQSEE